MIYVAYNKNHIHNLLNESKTWIFAYIYDRRVYEFKNETQSPIPIANNPQQNLTKIKIDNPQQKLTTNKSGSFEVPVPHLLSHEFVS